MLAFADSIGYLMGLIADFAPVCFSAEENRNRIRRP
jgi:hypothetical protein